MIIKRSDIGHIALFLGLCALVFFMGFPIFFTVLNAFRTNFEIMTTPFALPLAPNFDNFVGAWRVARFDLYLFNTFYVAILNVILVIVVASPVAYAFAKLRFRFSNLLFYALFIGLSIPEQSIILSVFFRMRGFGLLNSLTAMVVAMVGMGMPFGIFLMRNIYRDIPDELRESAAIDGASEWYIFLRIFFPLGKAGTMALVVFSFIGSWNVFMLPLVLIISPELQVISTAIAGFGGELSVNFGFIFAAAVISMIPSLVVYMLFQRSFTEGISMGATKG